MELGRREPWPGGVGEPFGHPLAAGSGQLVKLALRTVGLTREPDEPGLLEARETHIEVTPVDRLSQRAERETSLSAELGSPTTLLGQECQQHLLHDMQLVARK